MPPRIASKRPVKNTDIDRLEINWQKFLAWRKCQKTGPRDFLLPMPHNKANTRIYWRTEIKLKAAYFGYLDYLKNQNLLPAPPEKPPARVQISATMYLKKAMDTGNAFNRFKFIEDWLTKNGYLQDDSEACLEWAGIPKQVVDGKGISRIEIILTEVG